MQGDEHEELRALAINQLAEVFADLNVIRPLSMSELKRFGRKELRQSYSDLDVLQDFHTIGTRSMQLSLPWKQWLPSVRGLDDRRRHHGLLSKARRALGIADWSAAAQQDPELFRLVDCDGLTPLLALFSDASLIKGAEAIEAAQRTFEEKHHPRVARAEKKNPQRTQEKGG